MSIRKFPIAPGVWWGYSDRRLAAWTNIRKFPIASGAWREMLKSIRPDSGTEEAPGHPPMPAPE